MLASEKAKAIIKTLQIRNPSEITVKEIAAVRGAFVKERSLTGSEARLVRKGSIGIITINDMIPENSRRRFAIAHELGHFELHNSSQLLVCNEEDMFIWNHRKNQEVEANEFAANLLMPKHLFLRFLQCKTPNIEHIREVANEFRTSLTATALRYVGLSSEPCAFVVSRDGAIEWYKKSSAFDFHVNVGEKLSKDTYASDFYDGISMSGRPQKVHAEAWLAGTFSEDSEIIEHSFALMKYNTVLSLLWIDDDIRTCSENEDDDPEYDLTNPFTPDGKRWLW